MTFIIFWQEKEFIKVLFLYDRMRSILDLPEAYRALSPVARKRFDSIFSFSLDEGRLVVPDSMRAWARRQFGSVRKLERQPILKVTDQVMFEGALFNRLRADRPLHATGTVKKSELLAAAAKEPFADVEAKTPEDTFGRLYGRSEVSASNVAKYDALHGLIIFNRADPLGFTRREVVDHFNAARSWIAAAQAEYPDAKYPVIGWNCLWKAGASLVHGHLQVLVGKTPYATHTLWRERAAWFNARTGRDYWRELCAVHEHLGLGATRGAVRLFVSITPRKEKEVVLLSRSADEELFSVIYDVLRAYRRLGVVSFNVVAFLPPQQGFDVIVRIVDRGPLESRTADIGFAELYLHQGVVASDPVKVWRVVKRCVAAGR